MEGERDGTGDGGSVRWDGGWRECEMGQGWRGKEGERDGTGGGGSVRRRRRMKENLYIAHKKLPHKTLHVHGARYTQSIHVSSRKLKLPKDTYVL